MFGDYDVDGTTSATIVSEVIERCGGTVSTFIARRFDGGYGLSNAAVDRMLEVRPSLVVTCDCGSSDHERIERLRKLGVDVVVVDHHLVPKESLPAYAFLNPHQPGCGFAYKHMTSAGLAFCLGAALRASLGVELDMRSMLDLVALGTIADVAPMDGDNRRLVRSGLELLGRPDVRPGIAALRELAKIKPGSFVTAQDVAFRFAPRLNAAGRIADPSLTLALLRSKTQTEARALAQEVEVINQTRRSLEAGITEQAIAQVIEVYGEAPSHGIVVAGQGWHRGVVGITAARLVDRFRVPVVAIGIDDETGHGSCRAPDGFQLYDAVAACREALLVFGGHQAAAGLTVRAERVPLLRELFADAAKDSRASEGADDAIEVDVVLDDFGGELPSAKELGLLEPTGMTNPEPSFGIREAKVERAFVVGGSHLKLDLSVRGKRLSAFGYEMGALIPGPLAVVSVSGSLRADNWKGGDNIEMKLETLHRA